MTGPVSSAPAVPPVKHAYVGAYTRGPMGGRATTAGAGISLCRVAPDTGALTVIATFPSDNPSFLALHPTLPVLYAVNETADHEERRRGSIVAYSIDRDSGHLSELNRQDSGGANPAHLAVAPSGQHLVVANYSSVTFSLFPLAVDGEVRPASDILHQSGSGPNRERQQEPHPHGIAFDPAGEFVALADLGTDRVLVQRIDPVTDRLLAVSEAATAPGAGPRHLAFHPNGRVLYAINELDSTITAFAYAAASGQIGPILQVVPTVPADAAAESTTAELVIHPSGRFLYGSNRAASGATAPFADSIACFGIDPDDGTLTPLGNVSEGIAVPRHIALDPSGAWCYACNQGGDTIVQFRVDPASGGLTKTGGVLPTESPVCLIFV